MWPVSCRPTYGPLLRFDVRARTSYNCRDPGSHQAAHDASCLDRWLRPPPAGGAAGRRPASSARTVDAVDTVSAHTHVDGPRRQWAADRHDQKKAQQQIS
jgi:hypothetical protein